MQEAELLSSKCGESPKVAIEPVVEWRRDNYENAKLYKERTKKWHDDRINNQTFVEGKLKSHWFGPFRIKTIFPHDTMELTTENGSNAFKVNSQRIKPYFGGDVDRHMETIDLGKQD
ncbi:uncharacterized protein LOC120077329 [Benincasa hispida]|uniref:uncharacterized protein LOC120077329 n=1 Tax=Benincasa hispida TaxID=102211 RepID=UPI001902A164|nr:uncharacterized protein LOC120077329 [Benincasa hispida]